MKQIKISSFLLLETQDVYVIEMIVPILKVSIWTQPSGQQQGDLKIKSLFF